MKMGQSTYKDFKETFPEQAEGDFGLKLKELNEKTSYGRDSIYWREALLREFDLSYEVGNHSLHSGYYFVTNIEHSALDAIPILGSKTEKILCLMIYETESKITSLLVCKDPEHDMPVWSRHVGDPILESNLTRRSDFALFMVAALENDELIHEAPAIVGCQSASALAHASVKHDT